MLVALDLDSNLLVYSATSPARLDKLNIVHGNGVELRVKPIRAGVPEALPAGFEMEWSVKAKGDYGGPLLAFASAFVEEGSSGIYTATVNYATAELEALLLLGEPEEMDAVMAQAQLAWREDDEAEWQPTQVVFLNIHNSVWREGEGGGAALPSSGFKYYPGITGLTGGGAAKLDGIPTVNLAVKTLVLLVISDVMQYWLLKAGTNTEDAGNGVVRGDDYAATTNEKVWIQIF